MALLEVHGLSKAFRETRALNACSLRAESGMVHAVLGENGSGKSTLVKVLSGVIGPDEGAVLVGGTPIRDFTPRSLRAAGVATVFQDLLDAPNRSALDNV